MSLRLRSFLLVLVVVIPSLLAAIWAVISTYEREKNETYRSLRDTTRALALVVDRELSRRESIARALAASAAAKSGDATAFQAQASSALQDGGGRAMIFDRSGQLGHGSEASGQAVQLDPAAYALMLAQLSDGQPKVSALLTDARTRQRLVVASVPIADAASAQPGARATFLRAVGILVHPDELLSIIREQGLEPGWIAAILDQHGVVVARSHDHEKWIGTPGTPDMLRHLKKEPEGTFESKSLDGRDTAAFYSRAPRHGWTFVIAVPQAVTDAHMHSAVQKVALVGLLMVLLSGAAAVLAVRTILQPLGRLEEAAHALEQGLPVHYDAVGMTEFDRLGQTLQSASSRLRAAQDVLQQRVAKAIEDTRVAEQALSDSRRLEAVGRLTGGVAHDVNNLLGVVANNVALLKRLPPEQHAPRIEAISRSIDTGKRLTQKMLAFARKRVNSPVVIDLRAWLPSALPMLKTSVRVNVHLAIQAGDEAVHVEVDPTELEVALVNLMVNASDAMAEGGTVVIGLKAVGDLSSRGWAQISVSDSGQGMSPDVLSHVFEPFFTTKDESRGAGLGLSQVHGFCRQSGGEALIESTEGQGTTVTLRLPLSSKTPAAGIAAAPPASAARGKRILYVEDNLELAETTSLMLGNLGYSLHWASNAEAALEQARHERFDVVLTDVVMPGPVNGLALARALREQTPGLPVVLMTGYSREAVEAGNAGFRVLSKPCLPDELAQVLLETLTRATAPDGS